MGMLSENPNRARCGVHGSDVNAWLRNCKAVGTQARRPSQSFVGLNASRALVTQVRCPPMTVQHHISRQAQIPYVVVSLSHVGSPDRCLSR